tara:strand:- start:5128 stop:5448 length:321 start_codon:yes stop_codon:yes gene_type:complete
MPILSETLGLITSKPLYVQESSEGDYLVIKPVPGQVIAQVDKSPNMNEYARLFAAAPVLLSSLIDLVLTCEDLGAEDEWEPEAWHHLEKARYAIQKAKTGWVYESK